MTVVRNRCRETLAGVLLGSFTMVGSQIRKVGVKSFWLQANAKYPDFKHKQTEKALWLNGSWNPPWVEAELAAMSPWSVQLNIFAWNARLARYDKSGQYEKTMELYHQTRLHHS